MLHTDDRERERVWPSPHRGRGRAYRVGLPIMSTVKATGYIEQGIQEYVCSLLETLREGKKGRTNNEGYYGMTPGNL